MFDEYPNPPELTKFGLPISFFKQFELKSVNPDDNLEIPNALKRFNKNNPDYVKEYFNDNPQWGEVFRRISLDELLKTFSLNEILRHVFFDVVMSEASEELHKNPKYMLFRKLRNSFDHWGRYHLAQDHAHNWNLYVKNFNSILNFDFGIPGFESYVDFASWYNEFGYSQFARVYVDGALSFNIVYKGEHVLTIGYAVFQNGILITQIQPKKQKGNRWLFKVKNHFEHCIERMQQAFKGQNLWLVTGETMANFIQKQHKTDPVKEETLTRIQSLYNQPMRKYERWKEKYHAQTREFLLLGTKFSS